MQQNMYINNTLDCLKRLLERAIGWQLDLIYLSASLREDRYQIAEKYD